MWYGDTFSKDERERIYCNMTDVLNGLGIGAETAATKWKDTCSLEEKLWPT